MSFEPELDGNEVSISAEPRREPLSDEQIRRFEGYIAEIFSSCGLDVMGPAVHDAPRRLVRALLEATRARGEVRMWKISRSDRSGASGSGRTHFVQGPMHFFGLGKIHVLPFHGEAYIGYVASGQAIEPDRLARLVQLFARRFTGQETMRQQIADAMQMVLHPEGLAVYLEAHHLCQPDVQSSPSSMERATVWRGSYASESGLRAEFLETCKRAP